MRKSPFDSGARRHTSFSAVFVSPEIDDKVEIEINPADLRIDTYRSSGAGGQHVNTTDSGSSYHPRADQYRGGLPERTFPAREQGHRHEDAAGQGNELEMQKRNAASQALEDSKSDIGWGHQIRSYVLDDSRIKDLRTGVERSDCQKVLDGDPRRVPRSQLKQGSEQLQASSPQAPY